MTSDFVPIGDRSVLARVPVLGVSAPELDCGGLVPVHALSAWEAAYRDYVSASEHMDPKNVHDRRVLAQLSAQVAVTWRQLAETPGIKWWLMATFSTAAQAAEQQARDWGVRGLRSLPGARCHSTESTRGM